MSIEFHCIDPPGGQRVRVRFAGTFGGRATRWDGEVMTLRYCCDHGEAADGPRLRPFIDVGRKTAGGRRVRVGLDVPCIDRPTVTKAVIMVRNYRRLREGRVEFGEPFDCPDGNDGNIDDATLSPADRRP
jgi:hypothetical protein